MAGSVRFWNLFSKILLFALSNIAAEAYSSLGVTITKPDQKYRKLGDELVLNCTVSGESPAATITWYKDGKLQNTSLGPSYWLVHMIAAVKPFDGGYYKCIAERNEQRQEDGVFINIEGKPVIITKGGGNLVTSTFDFAVASTTPTLHCYATGWPLVSFRWLKNGKEIKTGDLDGSARNFKRYNGLDLQLSAVSTKETGIYKCEARNIYGNTTRNISLFVKNADPHLDPTLVAIQQVMQAYVGDPNVTLSCKGENTKKLNTGTAWHYNGSKLTNSLRLRIQEYFYDQNMDQISPKVITSLTIFNVTSDDTGEYKCMASTEMPKNATSFIYLNVTEKGPKDLNPTKSPEVGVYTALIAGGCTAVILVIAIAAVISWIVKRRRKFPNIPTGPFKFSVFVTYNSKDYAWVKANLLPLFERNSIEYCIHYRNFEIGIPYYENMANSVYMSRVVIVVMSKNYMASNYCREELDYAIHRSVEEHGSSPLIIMRIDGIKKDKLPRVIRHRTFLDYTSSVEKETWERRLLEHVQAEEDLNKNLEDRTLGKTTERESLVAAHDCVV